MSLRKKDLHFVFRFADRTFVDSEVFEPDDIVLFKHVIVFKLAFKGINQRQETGISRSIY